MFGSKKGGIGKTRFYRLSRTSSNVAKQSGLVSETRTRSASRVTRSSLPSGKDGRRGEEEKSVGSRGWCRWGEEKGEGLTLGKREAGEERGTRQRCD